MVRRPNTNRNGGAWTPAEKAAVWQKGREIPDYSKDLWRHDACGKVMNWNEHGNRNSANGWEIDHINPVSNGGGDELFNLQPLNWDNNAKKGDSLNWRCGQ
jgi:5-methylcytosine-specific restriction endonuclease McrA